LLKSFSANNTNWQEETIPLPNKSTHYQIAFQAMFRAGGANSVSFDIQLDDISVFENIHASYQVNISTNSGVLPTGATVTLTNQDGNPGHIYTGISGENGVTFPDIFFGTYDMIITLNGYEDYIVTDIPIYELGLEHLAQLIETLVAPVDLSVEIDYESNSALFSWSLNKLCRGFTVYLNDEEMATEIQNTEYLFTDLTVGNHKAGVKADYLSGSSEIVFTNFNVLSIKEENTMKHYSLLPNPVQDFLLVKRLDATQITVKIYNNMGALVHSFETSKAVFDINVSNFNSGVYFICLSDNKSSITKSFVKQ
jgi:hypothetical protein